MTDVGSTSNAQPDSTLNYRMPVSDPATPSEQLASLLLKLMGVYFLAESVPLLQILVTSIVQQFIDGSSLHLPQVLTTSLVYGGYLLVAILLIWNANRIARRIAPPAAVSDHLRINSVEAQAIAFSVLGLYMVATPLPMVLRDVIVVATEPRWRGASFVEYVHTFIGALTEIVVGVVLFLRSRGLAVLWHRIRSTRRYDDSDPPISQRDPTML